MAKMMKATVRNGRATASGKVYNANHNTKTETRAQERHIDHSRTEQNINLQFTAEGRVRRCGSFDFKKQYGESTYDPTFVLAAMLDWAGIGINQRGFVSLHPSYIAKL